MKLEKAKEREYLLGAARLDFECFKSGNLGRNRRGFPLGTKKRRVEMSAFQNVGNVKTQVSYWTRGAVPAGLIFVIFWAQILAL